MRDDVDVLIGRLLAAYPPAHCSPEDFLGAQFDAGLAWVSFPLGSGGHGADPGLQAYVDEQLAVAGAPNAALRNPIGVGMGGPTLASVGTEDQQHRWLCPLFTGEDIWCQMFSEPGAGSDVAALATMAVRDGDEWIVNGQKVWTSYGHLARWGMLVARTDPDVPKHQGLTYFVADMHAPGVDIRPLRQMTGEAQFNEIYLTDVRIPDANRLGGVGDGWRVSLATLMNERASLGGSMMRVGDGPIGGALQIWRDRGCDDPVRRDRLVHLWCRAEVHRLTVARAEARRRAGVPGPEESIAKLAGSELDRDISEFCVDLLGCDGMLYPGYELESSEMLGGGDVRRGFLGARASTIAGGTSEILRNILGERVLGLPGEPRVDRGIAWRLVPRS